jgi:hypothetical protein
MVSDLSRSSRSRAIAVARSSDAGTPVAGRPGDGLVEPVPYLLDQHGGAGQLNGETQDPYWNDSTSEPVRWKSPKTTWT